MLNKKIYRIGIIVIVSVIALIILLNLFLTSFVENKISALLNDSKSNKYTTSVNKVDFNLFKRSIVFNHIFIGPKNAYSNDSLSQIIYNDSLEKITIASVKINNIHFFDYLFRKDVHIGELEINDLIIQKTNRVKPDTIAEKPINLDSIHIEKINSFQIDNFDINNVELNIIDSITRINVFQHKPVNLDLDGFQLKKLEGQQFKLMPINKIFRVNNIEIELSKKGYTLFVGEVALNTETSDFQVNGFRYKTINGKKALAKRDVYNNVVPEISIGKIEFFKVDYTKLIQGEGLFIDSVLVTQAIINLYKDKRKPFDKRLHKELPHLALKKLELPLYIRQITVENSLLLLEESFHNNIKDLKLSINNINGTINNVSSIKKYKENPIKINLNAKLMDKANLVLNFTFPMHNNNSTFYFDGRLGKAKLSYFDDIIYPALGLKILSGNLDGLTFSAKANKYRSSGTMKMLYHNLDATVYKHKHKNEKSKVLSWAVKTVLHNSNPKRKKAPRIAVLSHNYDPIKGFGNYLWKTLQSGIVNTLSPAGNLTSEKVDDIIYKKNHKKHKKRTKRR